MQDWQNLYVYYTDVDRLMVECLHSALVRHTDDLKHCYWERHYAGGPHIRVHLCAWPGSGVQLREAIAGEIESYIASHPSEPQNNYSPETVKKLLAMEEEEVPDEDLKYHVNVVLRRPEGRPSYKLASEEASELLADFFHDSMGLAVAILKSKRPKLDEALRLYFVEAIFAGGTLPDGAVSFAVAPAAPEDRDGDGSPTVNGKGSTEHRYRHRAVWRRGHEDGGTRDPASAVSGAAVCSRASARDCAAVEGSGDKEDGRRVITRRRQTRSSIV